MASAGVAMEAPKELKSNAFSHQVGITARVEDSMSPENAKCRAPGMPQALEWIMLLHCHSS